VNRLLVTGLGLDDPEGAGCVACNYDLSWLIDYPSVLLWADKIILTQRIQDTINSGSYPSGQLYNKNIEFAQAIKLVFELLEEEGLVEIKDPWEVVPHGFSGPVFEQVESDRQLLSKEFPNNVVLGEDEKVPGQFFIDGHEYCSVFVASIYTSLILSRAWNASCLFNPAVFNYCKFKFGVPSLVQEGRMAEIAAFHQIFQMYLPDEQLFPDYVLTDECPECEHEDECSKTYLSKLEKNLKAYLRYRDYDELHQIRAIINRIARTRNEYQDILNPGGIISEFKEEERKIFRRVNLLFPKVRRWTNTTTMLSIPLVIAGVSSGSTLLTTFGAATTGLSQLSKEFIDLLSSKYRWIGFISKSVRLQDK
jgi:hypothetical protein